MSLNKTFSGVITNAGGGTATTFSTIATDSFFANITAGTAAPTTVAFTTMDSASLIWDATTHTFQVAAASGGDITKAQNSNTFTINNDSVTYVKIQNVVNNNRFLGRISGAGGDIEELTGTQATTLLDSFSGSVKGLVPVSAGGTVNFLRADGTFAVPPGAGVITEAVNATTGAINNLAVSTDVVRFTGGSAVTLSGLSAITAKPVYITRTGSPLTILHASVLSTIPIQCPGETDITISARGGFVLIPDVGGATMRVVAQNFGRSDSFNWTGAHDFSGAGPFTAGVSGDVSVASTTGGLWLSAGHTPVVSPSVSNSDVLINATSGVAIFAGATPVTAASGVTITSDGDIRAESTGDLELNGAGGVLIQSMATPATTVATGTIGITADTNLDLFASGNLTMAAAGDVLVTSEMTTENLVLAGLLRKTIVFSSTMAGNLDNLSIGAVSIVRLNVNGATNRTLTGMVPQGVGQIVHIFNTNTSSGTLILQNDAVSTAANRFLCADTTHTVRPDSGVTAWYDGADSRWRILDGNQL